MQTEIVPNLWFDNEAEEAARFYTSIFPNSKITKVSHYSDAASKAADRPKGSVLTVDFELNGNRFVALNGGPIFQFNESVSFIVHCDTQQEIDRYWSALTKGGQESVCGWLKDRFGVSWQIVPSVFSRWDLDSPAGERAMEALLKMKKLDIATLTSAYESATATSRR